MKNSQMFAIMGVCVLGSQMHGWAAITLGTFHLLMAVLWLVKGK